MQIHTLILHIRFRSEPPVESAAVGCIAAVSAPCWFFLWTECHFVVMVISRQTTVIIHIVSCVFIFMVLICHSNVTKKVLSSCCNLCTCSSVHCCCARMLSSILLIFKSTYMYNKLLMSFKHVWYGGGRGYLCVWHKFPFLYIVDWRLMWNV